MKLTTRLDYVAAPRVRSRSLLAAASARRVRAGERIEAINVSPQTGGRVVVRVTLKEAPANPPAGFTVNNPPRIALDFPNTGNALGTQRAGSRRRRPAQHQRRAGGRPHAPGARISRAPSRYDTQIDGRTLLITLQGAGGRGRGAARRDHAFRRSRGPATGGTRCATSISAAAPPAKAASSSTCPTAQVGIDMQARRAGSIVVDFLNTALPQATSSAAWT